MLSVLGKVQFVESLIISCSSVMNVSNQPEIGGSASGTGIVFPLYLSGHKCYTHKAGSYFIINKATLKMNFGHRLRDANYIKSLK